MIPRGYYTILPYAVSHLIRLTQERILKRPMNYFRRSRITWVWAERISQALESTADVNLRIHSGLILAVYFFWTGNFKKASYVMNIFREAEGAKGATALTQINILLTEAMYEWLAAADVRSCLNKVMQGLSLAETTGVHLWDYHLSCHWFSAALSAGDLASAEEMRRKL